MANNSQYTNRSRLHLAAPAVRPGMKARLLLSGPSGAGKTFSALIIAGILAGVDRTAKSIVMLDTEKDSGKTYADEFRLRDGSPGYMHLPFNAPYNATDLAMTLRDISQDPSIDVVIVDSHTHVWAGQGGILDVAGGKYTGWKEARPMQVDMVEAMLSCDAHVILCARTAQDYVQEQSSSGKWEVRKVGMKIKQDADLEYEMNVALSIDMSHVLYVSKSRTSAVPVGTEFIAGHAAEFAGTYREWLEGGEPACSAEQIESLVDVLNRIEDDAERMRAKVDFTDTFGRPEMLLVSRLPEAAEWVADRLLGVHESGDTAPGDVPAAETHEKGDDVTETALCVREGCGHDVSQHEIGGPCLGTIVEQDVERYGVDAEVEVPCKCAQFVEPAPPSDEEPKASKPEDPELRARIEADVDKVASADLPAALQAMNRSPNGTVKNQRKRLVDARMKEVHESAAAGS